MKTAILAIAILCLPACVSLGSPTSLSPSQLEAERQARKQAASAPLEPRLERALDERRIDQVNETLTILISDGRI